MLDRRADYKAAERELRALLNVWDPIGVAGGVEDEYDCLIPGLYERLAAGQIGAELLAFVEEELVSHFGVAPSLDADRAFVDELVRWWGGRHEPHRPRPSASP